MAQFSQRVVAAGRTAVGLVPCASAPPTAVPAKATGPPWATIPADRVPERIDQMKITLTLADTVIAATLVDSQTAHEFVSLLPLTLTLEDYARTEKISDLPQRLATEDAPGGSDPTSGDIAYYTPWGNLAIFYRDAAYARGLVILGRIDGSIDALTGPGSLVVTIEVAD